MRPRVSTLPIAGLVTAEFLSLLGNQVAAVAMPILVLHYTQSPLVTGIASAGNVIPIVIAAIVGGKAIDRFGAWHLSVVADLMSGLSVLALPLAFKYFSRVPPGIVFLLVFIGALFDPTGVAARQTLVRGLSRLGGQPLKRINTFRGSLENAADFIGPVIGVGLIASIGTINTFFANAASFLLCASIFALAVPRKPSTSATTSSDVLTGVRFIFGHPQLRTLAVFGLIGNFVILPFLALLLPVLATQVFGSTTLLGICLSAFGVSATVGALSFSKLSSLFSRSLIFYGGLLTTASAIAFCGFFTTQFGVAFSSALAGLLLGASNPLEQTILQEETPKPLAGQVFTSLTAIRFASGPPGLLIAGALIELIGVKAVLVSGGGLLIIAAMLGWHRAPLQDTNRHPGRMDESASNKAALDLNKDS
ncbi:MAG TPA: MFS transporter [Blastocatellia bacterium]|nr:MFS transporter [Blastocatellia bacterium]